MVQNRVTKEVYESPQFLYMLVGAVLFSKYPKNTRMDYVKTFFMMQLHNLKFHYPLPLWVALEHQPDNSVHVF